MKRRNFLKMGSLSALGTTLSVNGISASLLNHFPLPLTNCSDVLDRVLVIIRLAGANDGLNTFVPLNQYNTYANLRPNIKLANVGQSNGIIPLDNTLAENKKIGIHPSMTGLKELYDMGKINIMNAVGYPNFNYSHFAAENILWGGKDGNYTGTTDEGMIGKFLNSAYPNVSGNPTGIFPDPLVLQFGNSSTLLSFLHSHGAGTTEYNMNNLESTFFANLRRTTPVPVASEYYQLLNYIAEVERSADKYYNRINACFNNGSNSAVTYPNTYLGKQLKTIARLIKGGSKTKVFQATLGSFDTHGGQVVSGATHTGWHANYLNDVASTMKSFYTDITNLGLSDKVLLMTFSEFGRKPIQNGSLGTDHGNIAPLILMGNGVTPGITGVNTNLSNNNGDQFNESERQHDYRQVYGTIFQDWLGASNTIINNVGLNATSFPKLNIINSNLNATPSCLSSVFIDLCTDYSNITETKLLANTVINGWSYYSVSGSVNYLFGIEKKPSGAGANTNTFEADVFISALTCSPSNIGCFKATQNQEGIFASKDFFNTKVISATKPNGWVNFRWFIDPAALTSLNTASEAFATSTGANYTSPVLWLKKVNSKLKLIENLRPDGLGIYYGTVPMQQNGIGTLNGQNYYEFNQVSNLHGTGGAAFKRVSNITENNNVYTIPNAVPPNTRAIRYNTLTKTFEGYDGQNWQPLH
jgi:uncharacterized protein (DUF1501 family)